MRTNIDIDDSLMRQALSAGPFKTKKDAVEAGLKLLARQASYREVLRWEGKLRWDDGNTTTEAASGADSDVYLSEPQRSVQETATKPYRRGRR